MKRIALAAIVTAAAALGMIGPAGAQGVVIGAGPGGVYVGNGYHRHHHHWRHHYDYARCRTIVRSHINRYGERVSVRRRVCD
jgi:hypothetical protein